MTSSIKLSRSALEQHIRCPQCFCLQRKLELQLPAVVPLTLAAAVDAGVEWLVSDELPASGADCDNCRFYTDRQAVLNS